MRALPYVLASTSLVLVIAACGSTDGASPASGDAGADASTTVVDGRREAGSDAPDDSSADAPASSSPTVGLPAAAALLGAAECAFMERCFTEYTEQYTGSFDACSSGLATERRGDYPAGALFDQAAVDATAKCFGALTCDALYAGQAEAKCSWPRPVNGAAPGAPCSQNRDCASLLCSSNASAACGTCLPTVTVKLGDACSEMTRTLCPPGAVCRGKCITEQGAGEACNGDDGTPGTMVCARSLSCIAGKCEKTGGPGAACGEPSACDPFQMQACDEVAGHCVTIDWLGVGAACLTGDRPHLCGGGMRCIAPEGSSEGTCQSPIQPGHACVRSSSCTLGYDCVSHVCVANGSTRAVCN